ncbi:hypothetical protein [Lignipirellula cremea]|uniref:Uncharacterized protein n=1 Tax=Lignipirellula cremea TaxID=2528010 RepID=A0A518E181_9BACT|nr:hypothetical protein [Lignipirellula cremea]QDU97824.1 hypothetical protein Pla8534_56810 [Lignipirellula cremea]
MGLPHDTRRDFYYALRFAVFGLLFTAANLIPYLWTRGHNVVVAGWPFPCYETGGIAHAGFNPWSMTANMAIAICVSASLAWMFCDGVLVTLWRWKNWGAPWAE